MEAVIQSVSCLLLPFFCLITKKNPALFFLCTKNKVEQHKQQQGTNQQTQHICLSFFSHYHCKGMSVTFLGFALFPYLRFFGNTRLAGVHKNCSFTAPAYFCCAQVLGRLGMDTADIHLHSLSDMLRFHTH